MSAALIAALLAGLLGGLHCATMCGAWIALGDTAAVPLLPARRLVQLKAATQAGRLATYTVLGAALGAAGGAAFALSWAPVQRLLYLAANAMLLLLALSLAFDRKPYAIVERSGLLVFRRFAPALGRLVGAPAVAPRFAMGMLWALTPCALVYGVLPLALFAGGPAEGAMVMLAFGLGTLPNVVAAGYALSRLRGLLRRDRARTAAACIVVAFAAAGLYRALFEFDPLHGGPFCLVP